MGYEKTIKPDQLDLTPLDKPIQGNAKRQPYSERSWMTKGRDYLANHGRSLAIYGAIGAALALGFSDNALAQKNKEYVMPQVADGVAGGTRYQSTFVIINVGPDVNLSGDLIKSDGSPMTVTYNNSRLESFTDSRFSYPLKKGDKVTITTMGNGPLQVGFAKIRAVNMDAASAMGPDLGVSLAYDFEIIPGQRQSLSVNPADQSSIFTIPAVMDNDGDIRTNGSDPQRARQTGIAAANLNIYPVKINMQARRSDNTLMRDASATLDGNRHMSRYANEFFPGADNFDGTIVLYVTDFNGKPALLSAFALEQNGFTYRNAPVKPAAVETGSGAQQVIGLVNNLAREPVLGRDVEIEAEGKVWRGITNSNGEYRVIIKKQ